MVVVYLHVMHGDILPDAIQYAISSAKVINLGYPWSSLFLNTWRMMFPFKWLGAWTKHCFLTLRFGLNGCFMVLCNIVLCAWVKLLNLALPCSCKIMHQYFFNFKRKWHCNSILRSTNLLKDGLWTTWSSYNGWNDIVILWMVEWWMSMQFLFFFLCSFVDSNLVYFSILFLIKFCVSGIIILLSEELKVART